MNYLCPKCGLVNEENVLWSGMQHWHLCTKCNSEVTPYRFTPERPTEPGWWWVRDTEKPIVIGVNPFIVYFTLNAWEMLHFRLWWRGYQFAPVVPHPPIPKEGEVMDGFYYLHNNGDLIFKKYEPESDSDFVKHVWSVDKTDRACAWKIVLESVALGAKPERVRELAKRWGCNTKDLIQYLLHVKNPTELQKNGLVEFFDHVVCVDYDKWMNWLGATPRGQSPNFATMPGRCDEYT